MQRPALVLLHGFTNTGASWQPVLRAVGERYLAHAPDIRGHGKASDRRPVTLEAVLGDLAAIESSPFTLVGYSMGGRIALHAALAEPERTERLVLIGASPGLADSAERTARRRADDRLAAEIERSDVVAFARRWAATPVLADLPAEHRESVNQDRLRNDVEGLAAALRGLGTGALPSLWERLGELQMPVTLVAGERDRRFTLIAEQMAARIPRSEVRIVPGAGHAAHIEAPGAIAALL